MKKLILTLSLMSVPFLVNAQTTAPEEPEILVVSDSLSYDDINKTSQFTGNVILTRGLMRLTADTLHITTDDKGAQHAQATVSTSPKITIYEERPDTYEIINAEGKLATYDEDTEIMHLKGQAVVTRQICGKTIDLLRGDTITYNSKKGTYLATGGANAPDKTRVRSVFQARSKADAAIAECRKRYQGKPMPSKLTR
ncbi:lipopolysaccharide transport periplasmic protein LptA [Pelistega sp. NLN82]|uniref:Lipopolysaccharide transport periplasmic protein LptA n=1 Tax=Pelistega ratti TaxID=2652177 RepID=A0A6L9Y3C3_9BURK|nr:lipopolysaccharide transport periplasmic protein LptA [Pelistega ratti]NEN74889.1 lipopolysaccharide transport periplasmic protein LptA [Pelistega ratti]